MEIFEQCVMKICLPQPTDSKRSALRDGDPRAAFAHPLDDERSGENCCGIRFLRSSSFAHIDDLFEFSRKNIQAGVMASDPDPLAPLMMLMLIEMLGRIEALEGQREEGQPSLF
jgi:hypothetical protein